MPSATAPDDWAIWRGEPGATDGGVGPAGVPRPGADQDVLDNRAFFGVDDVHHVGNFRRGEDDLAARDDQDAFGLGTALDRLHEVVGEENVIVDEWIGERLRRARIELIVWSDL